MEENGSRLSLSSGNQWSMIHQKRTIYTLIHVDDRILGPIIDMDHFQVANSDLDFFAQPGWHNTPQVEGRGTSMPEARRNSHIAIMILLQSSG